MVELNAAISMVKFKPFIKAIKKIAKFNRKEVTTQMLELCKNMDENKDDEDFQEETIKEFLKPRICLERLIDKSTIKRNKLYD